MKNTEIKPPRTGIKIADTEAIKTYLNAVNGRASSFVTTVDELQAWATEAESRLDMAKLPKARRVGVILRCRTAGPWANAYSYSATGNEAELKRFREGWRLSKVDKVSVYPRQPARSRLFIDEDLAAEISRRSVEDLVVIKSTSPAIILDGLLGETAPAKTDGHGLDSHETIGVPAAVDCALPLLVHEH